jgi:hypothetical protein
MRRPLTVLRAALTTTAATAAIALLAACSGGGGDTSASSSSASTSSSAAATTSAGASASGSEFCTQAQQLVTQLQGAVTDSTDPSSLPTVLQQAAEGFDAVKPPAEIADDWNALADGTRQLADAFGKVDLNDPQSAAQFQQTAGQLESQLGGASTNVENYLSQQCGIDTGDATGSASPTS